ncbi:MAG: 5-oxoprolinase subunit PxpB [Opitutales bacterium]
MHIAPMGDSAVVIELGNVIKETTLARVRALAIALSHEPPAGVFDVVPAFTSVTVFYDLPLTMGLEALCAELKVRAERVKPLKRKAVRTITIPVCYGGEFGPDLAAVAAHAKLSEEAVVARHAGSHYLVHAVGFTPGFPYLGGLPEELHTPRQAAPRTRVPAGSVGIGGALTGIYPLESPGGWNLIGRTPLALFRAGEAEPALLRVADRVKFKPMTPEEFAAWK